MCKDDIRLHVCVKLCQISISRWITHISLFSYNSILTSSFYSYPISFRYFLIGVEAWQNTGNLEQFGWVRNWFLFFHSCLNVCITDLGAMQPTTRRSYSLVKWRVRPLCVKFDGNVFTRSLLLKNLLSLAVGVWLSKEADLMTASKTGNYLPATACVSIWHLALVQYTTWGREGMGRGVAHPSYNPFQNSPVKSSLEFVAYCCW